MDNPWTDSEDSGDDDGMQLETKERDDHLIILVDCNRSYFEPNHAAAADADAEGKGRQPHSFFTFTMEQIHVIYRRKIIENPTSKLAVVFFGTRASNNADGFANIYVAVDARGSPQHDAVSILDRPEASSIRKLKGFVNPAYVAPGGTFEREVGWMDKGHPPPLRNALWFCALQFNKEKATNANSKIWLFTNNDSPYRAGQHDHERGAALTCAADLAEMDRTLTLWYSHPSPGRKFDLSVFYQQLIDSGADTGADGSSGAGASTSMGKDQIAGASDDGEPLLSRVRHDATYTTLLPADTPKIQRRHVKKRAMASVPLILRTSSQSASGGAAADDGALGGDIRLRVQLFKLVARAKRPPCVTVDTTRYQPLARKTQIVCEETGQVLQPQQIRTYVCAGGEKARVYMGKHEKEQQKDTAERGLTVLGFQPLSSLKSASDAFFSLPYNIGSSVFVYPHETAVVGSTTAFIALQRAMLRKRQFAVVTYRPRRKAMPRRAALLPQVEEVVLQPTTTSTAGAASSSHSTHSTQVAPPGMQLIPLPFHEEYRSLRHVSSVSNPRHASVEQVEAARSVVCNLPTFNAYEPECFPNASMAKFWSHLEALALEEDVPRWQPHHDTTCPPPNFLELGGSNCAQRLADLQALYDEEPDALPNAAQVKGKKRKSSALGAGRVSGGTAVKRKYTLEDIDTLPWDQMFKDDEVAKQTVNTLKLYCELHQLQRAGRKADLVARVSDHLYRLQAGLDVQEAARATGKDRDFEVGSDDEEAAPRYRRGGGGGGGTYVGGGGRCRVGGSARGSRAGGGDNNGGDEGEAARAQQANAAAAYEYDSADDMFND